MPSHTLTDEDFTDGKIDAIAILVKSGLVSSRSEGRRAIEQGGVSVNGEKVADIKADFEKSAFENDFIIKRGKKNFRRIIVG